MQDEEVFRTNTFHIAVRTDIKPNKIVWQDIVRIDKVYAALKTLKYKLKNPHYLAMQLPESLAEFKQLLIDREVQIEHQQETDADGGLHFLPDDDDDVSPSNDQNESSLLTKLTEDDMQEVHGSFFFDNGRR